MMREKNIFKNIILVSMCILFVALFKTDVLADGDAYQIVTDGDWVYQIKVPEAIVIGYIGTSDSVTIPTEMSYSGQTYPVKAVGQYAFSTETMSDEQRSSGKTFKKDISSITVTGNIDTVGKGAFYGNENLKSVTLPSSLEVLGDQCFKGCTCLTSVNIGGKVKAIPFECFMDCTALRSVQYPSTIEEIGASAFEECRNISGIKFYDGIKTIGNYAFLNCSSITEIHIPSGLTKINEGTFEGCSKVTGVVIPSTITVIGKKAFEKCAGLKSGSVVINEGVKTIDSYAFYDTTLLQSITIPESVTSIKNRALGYYDSAAGERVLTGFVIRGAAGSTAEDYALENNFTFVSTGNSSFESGKAEYIITGTNEAKLVTVLKTNATSYAVPATVVKGKRTYKVTAVGDKAFTKCKVLKSVVISDNVKEIGKEAFNGCKALKTLTIGKNVTKIGKSAFNKCTMLSRITVKSSKIKSIGKNAFKNINKKATVKVPKSKLKTYSKKFKSAGAPKTVTYTK